MNKKGSDLLVAALENEGVERIFGPNATVIDAIRLMDEKNVGALAVVDNGKLLGIVSERDYNKKVYFV